MNIRLERGEVKTRTENDEVKYAKASLFVVVSFST